MPKNPEENIKALSKKLTKIILKINSIHVSKITSSKIHKKIR